MGWPKTHCARIAKGTLPSSPNLKSVLAPKFFESYRRLPPGMKAKAKESYRLFKTDPRNVHFKVIKRLSEGAPLCSARITRNYRVLGVLEADTVIWFWIGSHDDYVRLIAELH